MHHTVIQFGQLGLVPTVGRPDQVTGNALQAVYMPTAAFGTHFHLRFGILVPTSHATVTVVVYRPVADIILVHHVHHAHDGFRIMGGIPVDFHVEDVAAPCQVVIGCLNFGLMTGTAFVIHRHMVGIGIILTVGNTPNCLRSPRVNLPANPSAGVANTL